MAKHKGFGYKLNPQEELILKAFRKELEIGFPVDCGLDIETTLNVLKGLTKKNILVGRGPYRLTKLGRRVVNKVNDQDNI